MKRQSLTVEKERLSLADARTYYVQGYVPEGSRVEADIQGRPVPVRMEEPQATGLAERFRKEGLHEGMRICVSVTLPDLLPEDGYLTIWAVSGNRRHRWFRIHVDALLKKQREVLYYIEEEAIAAEGHTLVIRGWVASCVPFEIALYDSEKKKIAIPVRRSVRSDVMELFHESPIEPECGFYMEMVHAEGRYVYLVIRTADGRKAVHKVGVGKMEVLAGKVSRYGKKGRDLLRREGILAVGKTAIDKAVQHKNMPPRYEKWLSAHLPSDKELTQERETVFPEDAPRISLVVPLYRTLPEHLSQLVDSVMCQTYADWELCLSDGSGPDSPLRKDLKKYRAMDSRIRVIASEEKLRIAQNTNAAIREASGDYIAFLDHDDVLTPNALFEVASALAKVPGTDIVYTDEDKMSLRGDRFFEPNFKPDFNPDLLRSTNYICHLFVVKRELLGRIGLLRPEYDGAQDYDLILRCTEQTDRILHIPKILYHWRSHDKSTAENPESKRYAFESGRRALQDHYDRLGIPAKAVFGPRPGLYRTEYRYKEEPLVSIIIPNKDHAEDLRRCIDSIEEKTIYRHYEYIIVENNSTEEETFVLYEELMRRLSNLQVVTWEGTFNYSAINNYGVSFAEGDYYLLLNNDTEVISPEWLGDMLGFCRRPDVGAVGARLYYQDNTIQHAGVVLGFGGVAGHCFVQQPRENTGYQNRIICAQNYSAVTAACMLVKKEAFLKAGGLTEKLAVAFNDVDFCLKVRQAGFRIVYDPWAELYHYESKSRGFEDTPEKVERFQGEIRTIEELWPGIFTDPDPCYNPNLTLYSQDFTLKRRFEK